jgi:serine/threonine protein kinase
MDLVPILAALTLRPLLEGTAQTLRRGVTSADLIEAARARLWGCLVDPLTDLASTVREACDRGWSTLELALAGPEWWARIDPILSARPEDGPLWQQLHFFFRYLDRTQLPDKPDFCRSCLRELQQARQGRVLSARLEAEALSRRTVEFVRLTDPSRAESEGLKRMAEALAHASYPSLAELLRQHARRGQSLLTDVARLSLSHAYRGNPRLRSLTWGQPQPVTGQPKKAYAAAGQALGTFGPRLRQLLQGDEPTAPSGATVILDVRVEQRYQQHRLLQDLYHKGTALGQRLGLLQRDATLADSMSVQDTNDTRLIRDLAAHYRALPDHLKRDTPALCLTVGKLLLAVGEFNDARQIFQAAAGRALDAPGQALAYWHACRAALERGDNDRAMKYLEETLRLDGPVYAPFPIGKYHPGRILGAGGLGVSFLCWHRQWKSHVVVKAILPDDLDRPAEQVLADLNVLTNLDHPSLATILEAGWTRPEMKARPYLLRPYFDWIPLEDHGGRTALGEADWIEVAIKLAEGMQALHAKGVLHRDLKPGNVYLRKDDVGWQVKIVNAGLGWRREALRTQVFLPTLRGNSLASSIACAAPELVGEVSADVGPAADVFSFGRTCSYALLRKTRPKNEEWGGVPPEITQFIVSCLLPQPKNRLLDFNAVLDRLRRLEKRKPTPVKAGAKPDQAVAVPAALPPPPPPQEQAAGWRWLPIPKDEPDPHSEYDARALPSPHGWPIVGARVRGKKHKHEGTNCDDWFEIDRTGHWSIIAVADGAGSRKFSRIGAKAICVAAVERLKVTLGKRDLRKREGGSAEKWFDPQTGVLIAEDWQYAYEAVLSTMETTAEVLRKTAEARARSPLHEKALGRKFEVDDLSATLLLAIHNCLKIDGQEYSFVVSCQVGDGMIAAILPDGNAKPLAAPDSGEHAGETDFVTSKGKLERAKLKNKTFVMFKPMRALMVMTDGVSDDYFPVEPGMLRLYGDLVVNRAIRYPEGAKTETVDAKQRQALEVCEQNVPVVTAEGAKLEKVRSAGLYAQKLELPLDELARKPEVLRGGALPLSEGPEPGPEESLRRWLDAYTVRGSFDDRTLVVLQKPGT